ncbi:hypothetical protein HDU87_006171 [Geranomyces variabilis]|uniref:Uncharacterized protein n=1 Tax=Geranomyces variabilis TaxID=109894 RepID=A0AAD5TH61_9FUNG|nr:hypothetical protein HDU87_006171 [Geranomyces variabilis]
MNVPTTEPPVNKDPLVQKINVTDMFALALTAAAQRKQEAAAKAAAEAVAVALACSKAVDAIHNYILNDPFAHRYTVTLDVDFSKTFRTEVERVLRAAGWESITVRHVGAAGDKMKCTVSFSWPRKMSERIKSARSL